MKTLSFPEYQTDVIHVDFLGGTSSKKPACQCTSWQIDGGNNGNRKTDFIFLGSKITAVGDCSNDIKRCLFLGRKAMTNLDSIVKRRNITLLTMVHIVKAMVFPVVMYRCESWTFKDGRVLKNWCFWTVVLEKTLESLLVCKEIKPVHPKGNQPWIFIRRTDAEAEAPILWPPDAKNQFIWKEPDVGKDFRQKEKGMTEYEMVVWHHRLNRHEFEQTLGDSETQGGMIWCSPWGGK